MPNVRDYCFTLFFDDEEEAAFLAVIPEDHFPLTHGLKYVIYQLERCPTTHRLHWQGYIKFSNPVSLQYIKQHFPILQTAHMEKRRGSDAEARDYCAKENTRELGPFEVGSWEGKQGQRSDLATYAEAVRRLAQAGCTWKSACRQLAEEFPGTHLRFRQHGQGLFQDSLPSTEAEELQRPLSAWQQQILDIVEGTADRRTIHWFVGAAGGEGKSTMAMHLVHTHEAIMLSGRVQDMAHAYKEQPAPVVVFDLPRTMTGEGHYMDHYYSFAEQLKNGCIFSSKYNSGQVTFKTPHVIFFANVEPDMTKWSADRYHVVNI